MDQKPCGSLSANFAATNLARFLLLSRSDELAADELDTTARRPRKLGFCAVQAGGDKRSEAGKQMWEFEFSRQSKLSRFKAFQKED